MTTQATTQPPTNPGLSEGLNGPVLCLSHIKDKVLKNLLVTANSQPCEFCKEILPQGQVTTLLSIEQEVKKVVQAKYNSLGRTGSSSNRFEYDSEDLVQSICTEAFADDVSENDNFAEILELLNGSFDAKERWVLKNPLFDSAWRQHEWRKFSKNVQNSSRFVFFENFAHAASTPSNVSSDYLTMLRVFLQPQFSLTTVVPAGTEFFRGRLIDQPIVYPNSAEDLGPAPAKIASANRMSPAGIPMFYASATSDTAVKEIAAHGVTKYARIGKFISQKPLMVLDLTNVPEQSPSPFDLKNGNKNDVLEVFRDFAENVTRPIIPDARLHSEYIPTQVVTEFFRWSPETHLDGLKLKSAQDGQDTFVLFFTADDVADTTGHASTVASATFTLHPSDVSTYEIEREVRVKPTNFVNP